MKTIFQARVSDNGKHLTNEEVIVGGKAFAGDRGISKVALSADGGSTWRFMAIMDSLFPYTRVVLTRQGMPSETGEFQFLVGATDGKRQWQMIAVHQISPSGTTGLRDIYAAAKEEMES